MVDVIKLAEGVANVIEPKGAEVNLVPSFDLKSLGDLRIIVVPFGLHHKMLARSMREDELIVQVGVLKRCTEDELTILVNQVSSIGLDLLHREIEGAKCVNVEYSPLYSPEHFKTRRQFTGVLELTFKEVQRHGKPH